MMRQIIAISGLALFLVLAFALYQVGQRSKQDVKIIGWANSLIWEAMGTASSPTFEDVEVTTAEGGVWSITGRLSHTAADQALPVGDYVAEIASTCNATNERRCWRLNRLSVDGRLVVTAGIVSLSEPPADVPAAARPLPENRDPVEAPASTPAAATETAGAAAEPAAPEANGTPDGGERPGLATLSALQEVQRTFEPTEDIPLFDQNGRPVPPIPRRKP